MGPTNIPVLDADTNDTASTTLAHNESIYDLNCQQCDYKASQQSHIRQHMQNVHEGLKYDCTSCDYKNRDKSNLKRHIANAHLGVT